MTREEIVQTLKSQCAQITFEKVNGELRIMNCTLREDMLPDQIDLEEHISEKRVNLETLAVWDLDKKDWRSFRVDKVLDVEII